MRISDFSYAKLQTKPKSLHTQCGTEGYVAPEILVHRPSYDHRCDMWTVGVIVFILLGGYRPFRGDTEDEICQRIRYGEYKFHNNYWKKISKEAKLLIKRMLTVDVDERISAKEALRNSWFQIKKEQLQSTDLSESLVGLKDTRSTAKAAVRISMTSSRLQTR